MSRKARKPPSIVKQIKAVEFARDYAFLITKRWGFSEAGCKEFSRCLEAALETLTALV
jgi:hypothetical protein